MICFTLVIAIKAQLLFVEHGNPYLLETRIGDAYGRDSDETNMKNSGFRFAWAVEHYFDRTDMFDERFVEWRVDYTQRIAGEETRRPLTYHKCDLDDFDLEIYSLE